jgi:hypothetical protein
MLKLDYDTREISFNDLKKCKTITYLKEEVNEKRKNQFLFNIYNNQLGITNNIVLLEENKELYIIKGIAKIEILKEFYEDKIKIDFIDGNKKSNPYFSELKSRDKRKFIINSDFRIIIINSNNPKNRDEIISSVFNSI